MTQRIFDIENEKDMADLWDILPDYIDTIRGMNRCDPFLFSKGKCEMMFQANLIAINWHDKTEITRPIQEATEADLGKLCKFWSGKDYSIGILIEIGDNSDIDIYCMEDGKNGSWFIHCRRLTKQEIEELC